MICVYSDSRNVYGGVEVLVARFSKYLKTKEIPFFVVERAGTMLAKEIAWAPLVEPRNLHSFNGGIDQCFFPSISKLRYDDIDWASLTGSTVTAWIVHPNDPFRSFFPYSRLSMGLLGYNACGWLCSIFSAHRQALERMFLGLLKGDGLLVMDGATKRAFRYFYPGLNLDPRMVAIPSPQSLSYGNRSRESDSVGVGYFGRMDDFKYSALKPFVQNQLAEVAKRRPVILHLVGDGPCLPNLQRLCNKIGVEFVGHGILPNEEARKLMSEKTLFAASMGTAALDVAATGHPCIIIDPALRYFARLQTRFRFVDEINDFTLGEYRDFPGYEGGSHEFPEILERLASDESIGARGRAYVLERHDPKKKFDDLLHAICSSTVTSEDISEHVTRVNRSFDRLKNLIAKF